MEREERKEEKNQMKMENETKKKKKKKKKKRSDGCDLLKSKRLGSTCSVALCSAHAIYNRKRRPINSQIHPTRKNNNESIKQAARIGRVAISPKSVRMCHFIQSIGVDLFQICECEEPFRFPQIQNQKKTVISRLLHLMYIIG